MKKFSHFCGMWFSKQFDCGLLVTTNQYLSIFEAFQLTEQSVRLTQYALFFVTAFEFDELCTQFYDIVMKNKNFASGILMKEFFPIACSVLLMLSKNELTLPNIKYYFTLPSGEKDPFQVELLIDVLTLRMADRKLQKNLIVICTSAPIIFFYNLFS